MVNSIVVLVLIVFFLSISWISKKYFEEKRTAKIVNSLYKLIKIAPVVALIVFTFLFTMKLRGQTPQRVTHALLVLGIWLCATQFYIFILSFYKNKGFLIACIIGMIFSIALAIIYTPLDRYVDMIYSYSGLSGGLLGVGLIMSVYIVTFDVIKRHR